MYIRLHGLKLDAHVQRYVTTRDAMGSCDRPNNASTLLQIACSALTLSRIIFFHHALPIVLKAYTHQKKPVRHTNEGGYEIAMQDFSMTNQQRQKAIVVLTGFAGPVQNKDTAPGSIEFIVRMLMPQAQEWRP